ncbi:MAG: DUF2953 domain-containing protein [Acetivibrio sp.]
MHIILFILKIIGIILLILLGTVLAVLGLVLWVPLRYNVNLSKEESFFAKIKVSWFLSALHLSLLYEEEKLNWKVKIIGITIFPKREKHKKTRKPKERQKKKESENELVTTEVRKEEPLKEEPLKEEPLKKEPLKEEPLKKEEPKEKKQIKEENTYEIPKKKKSSWILKKWNDFWNLIKKMGNKIQWMGDFFKEPENKEGFERIGKSLKKILKHLAPDILKGKIEFGMEDPCTTGEILGIAAVFYAFYGEHFQIIPNFEEACIKGEVFIKGRVRVFTLLWICIKLLLDNDFKRLRINFKKLKEVL